MAATVEHEEAPRRMKFATFGSLTKNLQQVRTQGKENVNIHANKPMPVYAKVKTCKNQLEELMRFMLRPTNTISHLRRYLAKKFKVHLAQVNLEYQNRILYDHQLMQDLGLGSYGYLTVNITGEPEECNDALTVLQDAQSFVSLQLRSISSKCMLKFRLEDIHRNKRSLYDLKLPSTFTAESLKMYLSDRLKRTTKTMKLTQKKNGEELDEKIQLRDVLSDNDVITLTTVMDIN